MKKMNVCLAVATGIFACSVSTSAEVSKQSAPTQAAVSAAAMPKTSPLVLERFEGQAMSISLGYGIFLNKGSKLSREWFVVADPAAPARVNEKNGVNVIYEDGKGSLPGRFYYSSYYSATANEPIKAIEIRVQLFDVFGRHIRTLSVTDIADRAEESFGLEVKWRMPSENEASEMFTSVMYVASVRSATGKVYAIDNRALLDQLRKVNSKITEAELEPTKPPLK